MLVRKAAALGAAVSIAAGLLTVAAPAGAGETVPVTVVCVGADDATTTILAAVGGSIPVPFTVSPAVPAHLSPGDSDTVSFGWSLSFTDDVVTTLQGFGVTSLDVSSLTLSIVAQGAVGNPPIPGTPPPASIPIPPPGPITVGPYSGTVEAGDTDIIYTVGQVTLTIVPQPLGVTLNLTCTPEGDAEVASTTVTGVTPTTQPPPTLPPTTTTTTAASTTTQQAAATTTPRFTG